MNLPQNQHLNEKEVRVMHSLLRHLHADSQNGRGRNSHANFCSQPAPDQLAGAGTGQDFPSLAVCWPSSPHSPLPSAIPSLGASTWMTWHEAFPPYKSAMRGNLVPHANRARGAAPCPWAGTALMSHALHSPTALEGAAQAAQSPHPFQ